MKGIDIMKKNYRRFAAIIVSSLMCASAVMTAIPSASAYDVKIQQKENSNDTVSHKYEAYQVFTGTLHGTGADAVLSDIDWGKGVKGDELLTELTSTNLFGATNPFAACDSAAKVAEVIDKFEDNSQNTQTFADIVAKHLSATKEESTGSFTIADAGYYFIKDQDGSLANKNGAYTDYILKVVDSVTITAKEDIPTIDKHILEGGELKEANTASVNDVITFQLDSKVPDMTGYNQYFFVINDTLCEGLTYNTGSLKVFVDDKAVDASAFEVQQGADAKVGEVQYTFQVVMKDFYNKYKNMTGKDIKVTYSATLNENADRTERGNENKVDLTYSNNPNVIPSGKDEPSNGDAVGKTPEKNTKTYTTGLLLQKIDGATKKNLTGAKFKITGEKLNKVLVTSATEFTEDAGGTYYKLKNGTYTKDKPTASNEDLYESTTTKYKATESTVGHLADEDGTTKMFETDVDGYGVVTFEGLNAGTYTITETKAPDGYNTVSPITIEITAKPTLTGPNWTVTKDGKTVNPSANIYSFEVENNKGATLPGTGGIGTTIFYIIGGTLVAGAVVMFITKKRMSSSEE